MTAPPRGRRLPSRTRVIGYAFEGMSSADYYVAEKKLAVALARHEITQFDGHSSGFIWWNGPPGAAMRALRDFVSALPGATPVLR